MSTDASELGSLRIPRGEKGIGDSKLICSKDTQDECNCKACLCVLGSFLSLFCSFGQMNSFGVFQAWYFTHQLDGMAASSISWIGSLQLFVFFLSGSVIGRLFDAIGPRRILVSGTAISAVSATLISISRTYSELLLVQGVLFGVGSGLLFYPCIAAISTHFDTYRATAIGVALSGSSIGGAVFPIMLRSLFNAVGFAWAVRITAFSSLVLCGISIAAVTSRKDEVSIHHDQHPVLDLSVLRDMKFLALAFGCSVVAFGIFTPYIYIIGYSIHEEISMSVSFYTLSAMNGGSILGRLLPTYLSDICGRFNLLIPSAFLSGALCLAFWPFCGGDVAAVMTFATLYGVFSGAFISLVNPCVIQISQMRQVGTRMGTLYSFIALPSLFGGPVAGFLLKSGSTGAYLHVMILSGSTLVVGSCITAVTRFLIATKIVSKV